MGPFLWRKNLLGQGQAYWQLAGRYLARIVPLQAQVTWPEVSVGVSVMVLPVMAVSPLAVAVTLVPSQATPLTYVEVWLLMVTEAVPGKEPRLAVASLIVVLAPEAAIITSDTLARVV